MSVILVDRHAMSDPSTKALNVNCENATYASNVYVATVIKVNQCHVVIRARSKNTKIVHGNQCLCKRMI